MTTLLLAVTLLVAPWTGTDVPTATAAAVKYRLTVSGTPNATVHLRAQNVAKGWIAAFCTAKVCSPMSLDEALPASGRAVYQFELIREDDAAARTSGATIASDDGVSVVVKPK